MNDNNLNKTNRLIPFKIKVGYAMGGTGDAIAYDFIGSFLLFFLTDMAGLSPALAGTIISLAVLWDAITDPVIGMLSDRSKSKYGKKRPFLLCSAIPLALVMMGLFHVVAFEGSAKFVYYLIFACLFWTAYTCFNIPYFSLGGCLTSNTNERTRIRSVAQVFNFIGVFFASAVPTFLVGMFQKAGFSDVDSWQYAVIIIGAIAAIVILISWNATRGYELDIEETTDNSHDNIFKEIKEVLCLRPYLNVILSQLLFYACYTISSSAIIYFTENNLGMGETEASLIYTGVTIGGIIVSILLGPIAVKFDKRTAYIACMFIGGIIMIIGKFIPIETLFVAILFAAVINIGSAGHWTLSYTLLYDIYEIDEFKNGKRREGFLMAFFSFCGKLGGAAAGSITGWILQFAHYDAAAAVQTPEALAAIKSLFTFWPGLFCLAAGFVILLYPVTRPRFELLLKNLELKRQGKEYSTEGFEKLIK
ncbi:MAG: glycoside-pentoside-hexuronide (GPH):cation symporter [Clostridiales bacterium]|nr:glycoside-pentoside-hexuronide (GPH):cation symporter [Clostridiales bacterium]MDD7035722.1 glycoside-pentoside-hexuronide (GPH):cation symporter [Bacillota bacterium]MDY2920629.1 glycoside-pentoside-hexuronide (GPH):cation symporter [Lentihominibacter sp.]